MKWENIKKEYPDKWILFEAVKAYSADGKRVIDEIALIDSFDQSKEALNEYKELHKKEPYRELYVAHTSKEELNIVERKWLGIRV